MKHRHQFEKHVGIGMVNGRYTAWVPKKHVSQLMRGEPRPEMYRCTICGEQGYEVSTNA